MDIIGFSTGSLCKSDFKTAINILKEKNVEAIEISALREEELDNILSEYDNLDLSSFRHISFHAPSKLKNLSEEELIKKLLFFVVKGIDIIVHPDIIQDFSLWAKLGDKLCIENMDNRKNVGQKTSDLISIFEKLPEATFCFDIAHSKQVDSSMLEGLEMLCDFKDRIKQFHISHVDQNGLHHPIKDEDYDSFRKLIFWFPKNINIIIESPVGFDHIKTEIAIIKNIFNN